MDIEVKLTVVSFRLRRRWRMKWTPSSHREVIKSPIVLEWYQGHMNFLRKKGLAHWRSMSTPTKKDWLTDEDGKKDWLCRQLLQLLRSNIHSKIKNKLPWVALQPLMEMWAKLPHGVGEVAPLWKHNRVCYQAAILLWASEYDN